MGGTELETKPDYVPILSVLMDPKEGRKETDVTCSGSSTSSRPPTAPPSSPATCSMDYS